MHYTTQLYYCMTLQVVGGHRPVPPQRPVGGRDIARLV